MNKTYFTFDEFASFINSQPDDKDIRMDESHFLDQCGCLIVQFARFKEFNDEDGTAACSFYDIHNTKEQLRPIDTDQRKVHRVVAIAMGGNRIQNFAQAKTIVKKIANNLD